MKKAILAFLILMLMAIPAAFAQDGTTSKAVKLAIPAKALQEANFLACQSEKAQWHAIAEAYRAQLVKLGWDCNPKDGGVVCLVEDGSNANAKK